MENQFKRSKEDTSWKFKKYEELQFSDDFMFWKVMTEYENICRKVIELCIDRKVRRIREHSQ